MIDCVRALCRVIRDALALDLLELLHERDVDAVRIVDVAAGIGHGYDLCAELLRLFAGIKRDVAGAGDDDGAAVEALARALEHFLREIAQAVARRLGAFKAAAIAQPLAGQRTVKFVVQAFVLAEQIADLAPADADVARRNVGVRTDVLVQLDHEALAEAHDLRVGFALRVKITAALCTADGQAGQAVFEDLLEAEKLDDALIDRRMEAQAALVRADGVVELDAKAAVDVDTAAVVRPRDAELDDAIRLDQTVQHARLKIDRMRLNDRLERGEYLAHRLMKLRFAGVSFFHSFDQLLQRRILHNFSSCFCNLHENRHIIA